MIMFSRSRRAIMTSRSHSRCVAAVVAKCESKGRRCCMYRKQRKKNRISVYLQTRVALTMSALPNFIRKKNK